MRPSALMYGQTFYVALYCICISLLACLQSYCTTANSYSLRIKKYVCIDTPYKESTVYACKSIPRRNAPTLVNVSVNVPKIYDIVMVKVLLFYKYSTYQPFLITVEGNGCEYIRHPPQFSVEKQVYDIIEETLPELLVPCPTGVSNVGKALVGKPSFLFIS